MKTISAHVDDFLHEYPFLSKFLRQGVINYKALARTIEPDISKKMGEKVSVGAIAVSLQRIRQRDKNKIINLIGRLRGVTVVTNVCAFTSDNPAKTPDVLQSILALVSEVEAPFILTLQAHSQTVFMVEKTLANLLQLQVQQLGLMQEQGTYAALVVTREPLNGNEFGGLSYPLQVLAEHGILVKAISATFTEEVIVVDESAADKAATILRHAMWR